MKVLALGIFIISVFGYSDRKQPNIAPEIKTHLIQVPVNELP